MSDTDIDYSDNDFEGDDEVLEVNEEDRHEERDEELQLAMQYGREGKHHALVGCALNAAALNDNVVTSNPDDHAPNNAGAGQPLPANVKSKQAKNQRQAAFTDAMKNEWGKKLKEDEGMRVASGFKPKGKASTEPTEVIRKAEPWHVKEAIERGNIKGDKSSLNETLYQFFNDFNGVVDAFGIRAANEESSPDHAVQVDSNGKTVFTGAMTYDHKQRATPMEGKEKKDGQVELASENRVRVRTAEGKGYDKSVRVITSVGAVQNSGYNPARGDLLLAERITDTKHRAEEVAVFVGPLLPYLRRAVFENVSATEIGESLGFIQPQASGFGNAILRIALEAASDAYRRIKRRERGKLTYAEWLQKQPDGMPIPARKLKQAYDKRAKIKAGIIAEVDQAIAHVGIVTAYNDNLPLTFQQKTAGASA